MPASRVGEWVAGMAAAGEPGRRALTQQPAAPGEAPSHYAASVASSTGSHQGLNSNFRKLKKCIASLQNTEAMGEKTITFKLKELSQIMDKVRAKLESEEDLEESFIEVIEAALDTADQVSELSVIRLDQLATEKDENKALISSRPKMAFEVFRGDFSQFATFKANQERIYEIFYDPSAPDKGASQQLFQLSKVLSQELAKSVLSYSGSENSARKAADWLALKFDSPQLMIPACYTEIKTMTPARNEGEIPRVAELVLRKIETLSSLVGREGGGDEYALPTDVVQAVFKALYLSRDERKQVLPYLSRTATTTITDMRLYIENRFREYEMLSTVLGHDTKPREPKKPRHDNPGILLGAAATTGPEAGGARGRGGNGGKMGRGGGRRSGGGRGGGRGGSSWGRRWPGAGRSDNYPEAKCAFCVEKKRPDTSHLIFNCPWITSASKSDLATTLPTLCLGCFRSKGPPGSPQHKCSPKESEGQPYRQHFCITCQTNTKLCKDPSKHVKSAIPATFLGHVSGQPLQEQEDQVALWTHHCVNWGSLGSPSLLTSTLTLVNEGDSITIQALWDPGSESSFFSSDLLPFSINQRKVRFKLETLSARATQAERVDGLEASFQVKIPGGDVVNLRLLQHSGLELRAHQ